jgi:hypothetical protein
VVSQRSQRPDSGCWQLDGVAGPIVLDEKSLPTPGSVGGGEWWRGSGEAQGYNARIETEVKQTARRAAPA